MSLLSFVGVTPRLCRKSIEAEDHLRRLVDQAKAAHDKLRAVLQSDPAAATTVVEALGRSQEEGLDGVDRPKPVKVLEERADQVSSLARKIANGH